MEGGGGADSVGKGGLVGGMGGGGRCFWGREVFWGGGSDELTGRRFCCGLVSGGEGGC